MIPARYIQLLNEYVAFKSVSTSDSFKNEIRRTAAWLKSLFESNGFSVEIIEGYGNPVVLARFDADPLLPRCLVYGHYDVQPAFISSSADSAEEYESAWKAAGWLSDPFTVAERGGRFFARGVVDNKGQALIHLFTLFELIREDKLGFNVTVMLEGNEETGSAQLGRFITDYRKKLAADVAVFSDGEIGSVPQIDAGFRGGFNATLTISTSYTDLHSGLYGSAVPSAAHEMGALIAKLHDNENRVAIRGFYDDVDPVEAAVLSANKAIPFDPAEHKRVSGAAAVLTEPGHDFYTQVGLRPAIQVTGIAAGYTGDGYRNSIPGRAAAKINFRLVKSQRPEKIIESFRRFLTETLPPYVSFELDAAGPYEGVKLKFDTPHAARVIETLEKSHGAKPVFKYCGGGLPVVTHLYETLGIPVMSVSLGNDDCAMHAPNENFSISHIEKGLAFSRMFFSKLS